MKFPWKKDAKLLAEAKELSERMYEDEAIFRFGYLLGYLSEENDIGLLEIYFRPATQSPDAILFDTVTENIMNIEFENISRNFEVHGHPEEECDLIVCNHHDEKWKNPIPVFELLTTKLHPPSARNL